MDIPEQVNTGLLDALEKTFTPLLGNAPLIRPAGASPLLGAEWVGALRFVGTCQGTLVMTFSNNGICQFAARRLKREVTTVDEAVFSEVKDCLTSILGLLRIPFEEQGQVVTAEVLAVSKAQEFSDQLPGDTAGIQLDVVAGDWKIGIVLRYTLLFVKSEKEKAGPSLAGEAVQQSAETGLSPVDSGPGDAASHPLPTEKRLEPQPAEVPAVQPGGLSIAGSSQDGSAAPQKKLDAFAQLLAATSGKPSPSTSPEASPESQKAEVLSQANPPKEPDAFARLLAATSGKPSPSTSSEASPESQKAEALSQANPPEANPDSTQISTQQNTEPPADTSSVGPPQPGDNSALLSTGLSGETSPEPSALNDEGLGELYTDAMRKLDALLVEFKKGSNGGEKERGVS